MGEDQMEAEHIEVFLNLKKNQLQDAPTVCIGTIL